MDLANLVASKHTVIKLVHPLTNEPLYCDEKETDQFTWTTLSKHTGEYKKLSRAYARSLKEVFGKKKIDELDQDELIKLNEMTLELVIDSTVDFNVCIDGEKPKFTKGRARKILANEDLFWLKDQVSAGANDAANFIPQ